MIVDLEEKSVEKPTESGTFDLKGGGKLHLRLLSASEVTEISKACRKTEIEYPWLKNPKTGLESFIRFEARKFDGDLWDEMFWDKGITGWEDLFDKNKKPIPVTKEMKILLMSKKEDGSLRVPEFVEAYHAGLKALKAAEKAKSEAAPANL